MDSLLLAAAGLMTSTPPPFLKAIQNLGDKIEVPPRSRKEFEKLREQFKFGHLTAAMKSFSGVKDKNTTTFSFAKPAPSSQLRSFRSTVTVGQSEVAKYFPLGAETLCQFFLASVSASIEGVCRDAHGKPVLYGVVVWSNLSTGQRYTLETNLASTRLRVFGHGAPSIHTGFGSRRDQTQ
jgi:hypothetical protein